MWRMKKRLITSRIRKRLRACFGIPGEIAEYTSVEEVSGGGDD